MHYQNSGDGDTIVLLHGNPTEAEPRTHWPRSRRGEREGTRMRITPECAAGSYRLLPATRADLLRRLGSFAQAADADRAAIELAAPTPSAATWPAGSKRAPSTTPRNPGALSGLRAKSGAGLSIRPGAGDRSPHAGRALHDEGVTLEGGVAASPAGEGHWPLCLRVRQRSTLRCGATAPLPGRGSPPCWAP